MEYTITKTKRHIIILSSCFLILYILATRLVFLVSTSHKIEIAPSLLRNIIYLIPFGYLMWVILDFCRHYKLKTPQISIVAIFLTTVLFKSTLLSVATSFFWLKSLFLFANVIWIVATTVLIIALSKQKTKRYAGAMAIRNYAIFSLIITIFSSTHQFYIPSTYPSEAIKTMLIVGSTSAIPFIFIIIFALRLTLKEQQSLRLEN